MPMICQEVGEFWLGFIVGGLACTWIIVAVMYEHMRANESQQKTQMWLHISRETFTQWIVAHMPKKTLTDLKDVRKVHETLGAFLLSNGKKQAWFPKSMTEENEDGSFTVPEWLAIEKEFV
jgi:hypothetical protein